jgi:hypothetical protein
MHVAVTRGGRPGTLCGLDVGPGVAATTDGGRVTCHDCGDGE